MPFDKKKINKIIDKSLTKKISLAEKGEVYADFALLYLKTINDLNRQYSKILEDTLTILRGIDEKEKEIDRQIDLVKVRREIKNK